MTPNDGAALLCELAEAVVADWADLDDELMVARVVNRGGSSAGSGSPGATAMTGTAGSSRRSGLRWKSQ